MTEIKYCKICGSELEANNPTDICYSCQSVMANMNMRSQGY